MVLLKTIDGIEIWVYENKIFIWSLKTISPFLFVITGCITMSFGFLSGSNYFQMAGIGITLMGLPVSFCVNAFVPGFTVWIPNFLETKIKIKKTTPEKDREAICKAMNELVKVAQEIARKKKELNEIAEFCKGR